MIKLLSAGNEWISFLKKGYRFGPPDNVFDALRENPENECYCASSAACNIKGTFNIRACKFGAPIALSWPHFLNGDEQLIQKVKGLNPDKEKHEFVMDFHPVTKLTLIISWQIAWAWILNGRNCRCPSVPRWGCRLICTCHQFIACTKLKECDRWSFRSFGWKR